jgi:hypothetical protein
MNLHAYHPNDPLRKPIHIDEWLVKYGRYVDGRCRICKTPMSVKAATSQRQTHFAHQKDSGCPTVDENHVPYAGFRQLSRDKAVAANAKAFALEHIEVIYQKMKTFAAGLTWKEMHELLETARAEDIWSLKDMPYEYIPYVLLSCTESFKRNNFGRKSDVFFVLEPSPDKGEYWNFPAGHKRYLWEIMLPSRTVTFHEIEMEMSPPWYMQKVRELLS